MQDSLAFEKQTREVLANLIKFLIFFHKLKKVYDEKTAKDLKNTEDVLEKLLDDEKSVNLSQKIKI